jgi:hypothetical protein
MAALPPGAVSDAPQAGYDVEEVRPDGAPSSGCPGPVGDVDHIPHDPPLMSKKTTIMSARRKLN